MSSVDTQGVDTEGASPAGQMTWLSWSAVGATVAAAIAGLVFVIVTDSADGEAAGSTASADDLLDTTELLGDNAGLDDGAGAASDITVEDDFSSGERFTLDTFEPVWWDGSFEEAGEGTRSFAIEVEEDEDGLTPLETTDLALTATYDGEGRFVIRGSWMGDESPIPYLDGQGPYRGTVPLNFLQGAPDTLTVEAEGAWTIEVHDTRRLPKVDADEHVRGVGDDFLRISHEVETIRIEHEGDGFFYVQNVLEPLVMDDDQFAEIFGEEGNAIPTVVIADGPVSREYEISPSYMLIVQADDGPWTISVP